MSRSTRRSAVSLVICAAVAAGLAPAAQAKIAPRVAADSCGALSQPFKPWLDFATYTLVPGGNFEAGGAAWSLVGASAVAGNESFYVGSATDKRSLSIPAGATATSPAFCGGLDHPALRLFAKASGLLSLLNVTVTYVDGGGLLRSQSLGLVTGSSRWQPSLPLLTLSGLPIVTGSSMRIQLTALSGNFTVDDVYVDPYSKRMR